MCKLVILVGLSLNTMGTGQWSCISLLWLWLISQADYSGPKQQCWVEEHLFSHPHSPPQAPLVGTWSQLFPNIRNGGLPFNCSVISCHLGEFELWVPLHNRTGTCFSVACLQAVRRPIFPNPPVRFGVPWVECGQTWDFSGGVCKLFRVEPVLSCCNFVLRSLSHSSFSSELTKFIFTTTTTTTRSKTFIFGCNWHFYLSVSQKRPTSRKPGEWDAGLVGSRLAQTPVYVTSPRHRYRPGFQPACQLSKL